jgi:hypothetical protein
MSDLVGSSDGKFGVRIGYSIMWIDTQQTRKLVTQTFGGLRYPIQTPDSGLWSSCFLLRCDLCAVYYCTRRSTYFLLLGERRYRQSEDYVAAQVRAYQPPNFQSEDAQVELLREIVY